MEGSFTVICLIFFLAMFLAGCAAPIPPKHSSSESVSVGTTVAQGEWPAKAPPRPQMAKLEWSQAMDACLFSGPPRTPGFKEEYETQYRPELATILYGVAPVNETSWGSPFNATFRFSSDNVFAVIVFWQGAVGPGGTAIASQYGGSLVSQPQTTFTLRAWSPKARPL